jgi:hypothetical protein
MNWTTVRSACWQVPLDGFDTLATVACKTGFPVLAIAKTLRLLWSSIRPLTTSNQIQLGRSIVMNLLELSRDMVKYT